MFYLFTVIKEEPSNNNNNKDLLEMDNNHVSIENNLSDAAFSDDDEDELPIGVCVFVHVYLCETELNISSDNIV